MSGHEYSVLALLPESSDFSLDAAVSHFERVQYPRFKLRAQLVSPPDTTKPTGFRVIYPDWSIIAWLETRADVLAESKEMATEPDIPATSEVIGACSRRLSVWSDPDPDMEFGFLFDEFLAELRDRFGALIKDNVLGGWRV